MAGEKERVAQKPCTAVQFNKHVPDFSCKLLGLHGGPHIDPRTETRWRDPEKPHGMRRRSK